MKHEREINPAPRPSWRLKKTLAREVEVRPVQEGDLKYLWAAYRKGVLAEMFEGTDLDATEFREAFDEAAEKYSEGWVVVADTKKGRMPIGIVLGAMAPLAAYLIIVGIAWFPWASPRNIVEGTVAFFNDLRKQVPWIGYAREHHKRLYEVCCMHGIMRRIGTSFVIFPGHQAAVFEGRPVDQRQ